MIREWRALNKVKVEIYLFKFGYDRQLMNVKKYLPTTYLFKKSSVKKSQARNSKRIFFAINFELYGIDILYIANI